MVKKLSVPLMMFLLAFCVLIGCSSNQSSSSQPSSDTHNKGTTPQPSGNKSQGGASSSFNKSGFPIMNKQIKLTIFGPLAGKTPWKDRQFFKAMKKKTNISFNFKTPPLADFDKKKNIVIASNDLPDIFFASDFDHQEQVKYGSEGLIIPLEGLIKKYAPNIQKMFEEKPAVKKAVTAPNGHIYALPYVNDGNHWSRGPMWYNGTWLDNLGVTKLPTTTKQLFNLLMRFKKEDPNQNGQADEIPMTGTTDDFRSFFLGAFGQVDYQFNHGIELINGKVEFSPIQPGYKDYLKYMNKLWKNGLLGHQSFSQTVDQKKAKGHNHKLGLFSDYFPYFTLGGSQDSTNNPMMAMIKGPNVDKPIYPSASGISGGAFAISKTNKYPAASIRWVDYLYSKEGNDLANNGKEGTYWKWKDPNKKKVRIKKNLPKGFASTEDYRGSLTPYYGIVAPTWNRPAGSEGWHWGNSKFSQWVAAQTQEKLAPYFHPLFPPVFLSKDEVKTVNNIQRDLTTYVQQNEAKFITGARPLSDWDKYVKTIKSMGVGKIVSIYSKAYKRYESK